MCVSILERGRYVMAKAARVRVEVKPTLLRWARERAGLQFNELARRFPRLARWETRRASSSSASPRRPSTISY
jgi:hypothetical protein